MRNDLEFTAANKYRKISPELQRARFSLIDYAIANPEPFSVERGGSVIAEALGDESRELLQSMIDRNLIGLNEDGDISYLYPVSCEETSHRVRLADGREFCAMCAIDALGCAATFGMAAEINSATKDTEEDVHAFVTPGGIESITPDGLSVSYYDSWIEGSVNF